MTLETDYDIGDKVFYLYKDKIEESPIIYIDIELRPNRTDKYWIINRENKYCILDSSKIFDNKAMLLKSLEL
jgi:hypothetical protein